LNTIDTFVWGPPLLVLLVGTGIWLTIRLKLLQVFKLGDALKLIFFAKNDGHGDVNSFKALCTALAATVGTGNIVGVATAIKAGGPGALFWMWMAAFFGMATKYAECLLAVKYRTVDANGNISGGPMYYIEKGMGKKYRPLAILFAAFGVLCAYFGIGTFAQVNSIVEITQITAGIPVTYTGIAITVLVAVITIGGLQSIANVASKIVPFMAMLYLITTVGILIIFADQLPSAFASVIDGAFTGTAATGGFLGATVMMAMRNGVARGVFSNESGLGSAPIVAAAAKTKWPAEQGLVSMTGTFIDTIVICTMTGLSIVLTGAWQVEGLEGVQVTTYAFQHGLPIHPQVASFVLMVCLVFFAFTTILGWDYYSERCLEYLTKGNRKTILAYRWLYIFAVFIGPYMTVSAVWTIADIFNGLMAIPNMIAMFALSGVVVKETKSFFKAQKHKRD
jgi:AGCS family alanine or glycine:cation symporter